MLNKYAMLISYFDYEKLTFPGSKFNVFGTSSTGS